MMERSDSTTKVAIIGSGLIGRSWSLLFIAAGYSVNIYDVSISQLEAAAEDIKDKLNEFERTGVLRGSLTAEEQYNLLELQTDLETCLRDVTYVQECAPEILDVKKKVFTEIDSFVSSSCILASSSSAIPASKFTESLKNRDKCIISHPVNPPHLMPLVELVPAPWTDPQTVIRAKDIMRSLGQSPVVLKKEVPGFVQPRIQWAMIQECLRLVLDNVMSVEDVDKVMTEGLGRRYAFMGPFETIHLNGEGTRSYIERYSDMIYDISENLGSAVRMTDNPDMDTVIQQLNQITPLADLDSKRKWRDERMTALAALRNKMNLNGNK